MTMPTLVLAPWLRRPQVAVVVHQHPRYALIWRWLDKQQRFVGPMKQDPQTLAPANPADERVIDAEMRLASNQLPTPRRSTTRRKGQR